MFDLFTILPLAAALFVFWKLRQVLGTRGGAEPPADRRPRVDPARDRRTTREPAGDDGKVVSLPPRDGPPREGRPVRPSQAPAQAAEARTEPAVDTAAIERHANGNETVRRGLAAISERDGDFHPDEFLGGARMAYEMIVTAFADGDKATLRNLLSQEVYESFEGVIDDRARRGEHVEASFVGIEEARIVDAGLDSDEAQVSVAFVSQMISATKNAEGEVVDGDEQEVAEVTDRWTFARSVTSRDPNWNLVATDA